MKRIILSCLVMVVALVFLVNNAEAALSSGMSEVQAAFSVNKTDGSDNISSTGVVGFNFFLAKFLSIGASVYGYMSDSDNYEYQSVTFSGVVDLYLAPGSSVIPYIGVLAGMNASRSESNYTDWRGRTTSSTSTDSNFSYGAHAGFKIFVKENTSLNIEGRYTTYEFGSVDINQTQALIGFSVYL